MPMNRAGLSTVFSARFGNSPSIFFRAPSRANIIGEHVDYSGPFRQGLSDGHAYALPFALPYSVCVSARPVEGTKKVVVHSVNFDQTLDFDPGDMPQAPRRNSWENYVLGCFASARKAGLPVNQGAEMQILGDVPIGAGISSSAALTVAQQLSMDRLFSWGRSKIEIARLAQGAEHSQYVGVPCGLLDQMASLFGQQDKAIKVDFGNMGEIEEVSLSSLTSQGYKFLLVNSGVERGLGGTYYGDRRNELEMAGRILSRCFRDGREFVAQFSLKELEDLGMAHFFRNTKMSDMPKTLLEKITPLAEFSDNLFERARYVLAENERTLKFHNLLKGGPDMTQKMVPAICCALLNETGEGLSDKGGFKISTTVMRDETGTVIGERPYMDFLRDIVINVIGQSDVHGRLQMPFGVRLVGGGGGGNLIALLPREYDTASMRRQIEDLYLSAQVRRDYGTSFKATFIDAEPSAGAGEVTE